MGNRDIIVMGASAGGLDALKTIFAKLPAGLPASIFIVWHMSPDIRGVLPQILNIYHDYFAAHAVDREPIERGRIYVAPPDHHLLIEKGHIRVTRGPKENRFRPAVDPLFRSAAYHYGPRVIGVVLSGALDDGMAGLWTIKHRGGVAVVQDPADAEVPSMPENAIREVAVDHILPAAGIPEMLARLSREEIEIPNEANMGIDDKETQKTESEIRIAMEDDALKAGIFGLGELSPYTCPECHGVLSAITEGKLKRFRCHTGHAYSTDALLASVSENIEESLWSAIRGIDECIILLNHMGDHLAEVNQPKLAAHYFKKANEASRRNDLMRQVVTSHEMLTKDGIRREVELGNGDGAALVKKQDPV